MNKNNENNNNTIKYEKIKIKEKDKKLENKENKETSYFNDKNKKTQIIKTQESRRSFKKISGENSKNIRSKDIPITESSSILEKNLISSKTEIAMIEPQKFSIRNKYKRKNGLI